MVSNSLTKANQKLGITAYLTGDAVRNQINNVVGKDGSKFITSIVSAVNANPALAECTNQSILSAALLGESLKLSPSPQLGFYYMVPFVDKERGKVAQFQLGYKGYVQLAVRTGVYKSLNVLPIKQGELVKFDPLNEEITVNMIEDEEVREKTPTTGYYASFTYLNGFKKSIYWSKAKMISHANHYSRAFKSEVFNKIEEGKIPQNEMWKYSSPWYSDFDGMACKTMIRQLISKWGLMSDELEKAYNADQGVIGENGSVTYVDNDDSVVEATAEPVMPEPVTVEAEPVKETKDKANDIQEALFGGEKA